MCVCVYMCMIDLCGKRKMKKQTNNRNGSDQTDNNKLLTGTKMTKKQAQFFGLQVGCVSRMEFHTMGRIRPLSRFILGSYKGLILPMVHEQARCMDIGLDRVQLD